VLAVAALVAWAGLGAAGAWIPYLAAAADVWFLGHGVDVVVPAATAFPVTIALLGPALVTALAGVRAGRRAGATALPVAAIGAGTVVVVVASVLLVLLTRSRTAGPDVVQAVLLPAAVYLAALLVGLLPGRRPARRGPVVAGLRAGTGAAALVLAAGALAVAALLAVHLPAVVGLSESSGAGVAGGLALTALQIAALPTVVVWAAAWLTGAGFSLGAGSVVGPLGTVVGPLPSVPLLGALPHDPGSYGVAFVLVPVLAGFGVGVALKLRGEHRGGALRLLTASVVAGVTAGALLGLLSVAASGAIGPGRLTEVGPDALQVAWRSAVEVGVAVLLGGAVVRRRPAGPTEGSAAEAPR
jgi:hypothetical protein